MTDKRTLTLNTAALVTMQVTNVLLPLLLIPLLARELPKAEVGLYFFATGLVAAGHIIAEFGFMLSGVKAAAVLRQDRASLGRLWFSIATGKLVLACSYVGATIALVAVTDSAGGQLPFVSTYLLSVVAQSLLPTWLFHGLERMGSVAAYTLASRLVFVGVAVLVVTSTGSLFLVGLANLVSLILGAVVAHLIMRREGVWYHRTSISEVLRHMRTSVPYFASRAAVMGYTTGPTIYLGFLAGAPQVAKFASAEQLYRGGQVLVNPLVQALYPYMLRTRDLRLLRRIIVSVSALTLVGALAVWLVGPVLLELVYGPEYRSSFSVLMVFMVTFVVATPSMLIGYPGLGAVDKLSIANGSAVFGLAVHVVAILGLWVADSLTALHVAFAVLITELVVLVIRLWCLMTRLRELSNA
ncbi:O-antigen/teichoic acid export membrane protein [Nocardioides sp. J9]|uniref:oligosaccharide flippase family protein n=1 Tax=Nocardioides sp. J9 TaxID=935844 RepID=UPI0011A78AD6|nr:oligosaccharide flippase family protein [Nocardioides sp. J9]TWG93964.1 O-antigen/teichoic acid export membrane protein [Nocardioides sp. J9]